jgi:glycerol-3-phosphate responsive antiterminator
MKSVVRTYWRFLKMDEQNFHIIPSITNLKMLETALDLNHEYIILSESHIGKVGIFCFLLTEN